MIGWDAKGILGRYSLMLPKVNLYITVAIGHNTAATVDESHSYRGITCSRTRAETR